MEKNSLKQEIIYRTMFAGILKSEHVQLQCLFFQSLNGFSQ